MPPKNKYWIDIKDTKENGGQSTLSFSFRRVLLDPHCMLHGLAVTIVAYADVMIRWEDGQKKMQESPALLVHFDEKGDKALVLWSNTRKNRSQWVPVESIVSFKNKHAKGYDPLA